MADFVCPRGHLSTDPDFCSECGLRIAAPADPAKPAGPAATAAGPALDPCPDCGTPRAPGARFCEVCRHDFAAPGAAVPLHAPGPLHGPPPAAAPIEGSAPVVAAATSSPEPAGVGNLWVVVRRDPDRLDGSEGAPAPERAYPLDLAENLVGRRNGRRDVHPEIPVDDPSVSARHLKICRRPDGGLYAIDVGSSNGTSLNGAALSEGVAADLRAGDRLAIGAFSVLTLEAR